MSQAFHSKHPDRTPAVERQLEAYLEHVASGESPDLEAFAAATLRRRHSVAALPRKCVFTLELALIYR